MIPLQITGGFYESDSLPISAQQCTNWYVNIPQTEGALTQGNLFGTPGLAQLISSGTTNSANRGSHVKAGIPYFLNGTTLYRLDRTVDSLGVETFTLASLGTIAGTERASFADNGTEMIIIAGGSGWIMDESVSPTITLITDVDFTTTNGTPEQVKFVDSFFVVTTDSKKFIRSNANDGLTWNPLNFFSAESDPDDIVSLVVHKNQVFIAGAETIEEFRNLAGVFQRSNFIIDKGVFSPFGIVNTSDSFMFVGGGVNESPAIWALSGNSVQKVSTTAIDAVLREMSTEDIQVAFAWVYAQSGAYFVGFTFPTRTFVFDTITGKWHERKSQITDAKGAVTVSKWRMNSLVSAYNKVLCGDAVDGRIGNLSLDVFTEYEDNIVRTFTSVPFSNQGDSFAITKLVATMEGGVGDAVNDPQLRLSVSKDAKKYNNEISRGFGKIGEFLRQPIWRGLGRFTQLSVLRFVLSDAVKPVFIKLEADIRGGR